MKIEVIKMNNLYTLGILDDDDEFIYGVQMNSDEFINLWAQMAHIIAEDISKFSSIITNKTNNE